VFLGVPVLTLTATADKVTQEAISNPLCLKADHTKLLISPNRENLRFSVHKVKKELLVTQIDWLV
jgi:superfamily II DNA helicase RecQ